MRMAGQQLSVGRRLTDVPMYYKMPAAGLRPDLLERFPNGTTTLDLIKEGLRTSTTRSPFASPGDVLTFRGHKQPYQVIEVARPDLASPAGRSAWEQAEGWNLGFIDADPKLRSQVYSPRAVQTLFQPFADQPAQRIYAGIGSRETPAEVQGIMRALAAKMEQDNWLLRSGGARGADAAFEAGVSNPAHRAIFLPGQSFNGRRAGPGGYYDAQQLPGWTEALGTVTRYHPSRGYQLAATEMAQSGGLPLATVEEKRRRFGPKTDRSGRPLTLEEEASGVALGVSLQARNAMQVAGPNLNRPADRIVAWTPGGEIVGGTGQALRMAQDMGIEIRNLGDPRVMRGAMRYLGEG